jgi:hypothetical protein
MLVLFARFSNGQEVPRFVPLEQWKAALLKTDGSALRALYSSIPPAQVNTTSGKVDADADVAFWTSLKPKSVSLTIVEFGSPRPGVVSLTAEVRVISAKGRTTNIVEGQSWQDEGGVWRLIGAKRDIAKLAQPRSVAANIYPAADAHQEIRTALDRAGRDHKNILVIFGADWCYDCHVLEKAFRRPDIAGVLNSSYELVHVDIGLGDKNTDIAAQLQVPLDRGVPAVAVLDSRGKLLYSQKHGEWERARALGAEDLLALLNQWKPR